ncbi:MAG: FeoA family protein [Fusobacteriaceae bacterium]
MKLTELRKGQEAKIIRLGKVGELKKRLSDMGINSGEVIKLERNAPLGDPQEYRIRGTSIAIRKIDAENIEIEGAN